MNEPLVPREEARTALEARRELGPAYEDELVERFAERIEARLRERRPAPRRRPDTPVVVVSLLAAIPLVAIAGGTVGVPGVALVCLALVCINYFASR